MSPQEQINWLIRQVNRMNNSHCGDGCDYTVPEGCVVWTGEPLMCGETILANEGDRMDVVQQNIVSFLCSSSGVDLAIEDKDDCLIGGFTVFKNGEEIYSHCYEDSGYVFEEDESCPNGGIKILIGEAVIFQQCYKCCNSSNNTINYQESIKGLEIFESPLISVPNSIQTAYPSDLHYVITASDGPGMYESFFTGSVLISEGTNFHLGVYVNTTIEDTFKAPRILGSNMGSINLIQNVTSFKSNIFLNVGDTIGIGIYDIAQISVPSPDIQQHKWKLSKIY